MFGVRYIQHECAEGHFRLVRGGEPADFYVSPDDDAGVARAADDLREDVNRVAKALPLLKRDPSSLSGHAVIIGTVGKSAVIDRLIEEGKLDAGDLAGKWEAFVIQTVPAPLPGVELGLVIAGSDKRGTIFGIYDVSEQIGVSPWHWWADVPVPHRDTLIVRRGTYKQGEPGGAAGRL